MCVFVCVWVLSEALWRNCETVTKFPIKQPEEGCGREGQQGVCVCVFVGGRAGQTGAIAYRHGDDLRV